MQIKVQYCIAAFRGKSDQALYFANWRRMSLLQLKIISPSMEVSLILLVIIISLQCFSACTLSNKLIMYLLWNYNGSHPSVPLVIFWITVCIAYREHTSTDICKLVAQNVASAISVFTSFVATFVATWNAIDARDYGSQVCATLSLLFVATISNNACNSFLKILVVQLCHLHVFLCVPLYMNI